MTERKTPSGRPGVLLLPQAGRTAARTTAKRRAGRRCRMGLIAPQAFGTGGGSTRAGPAEAKPVLPWVTSQKGLLADCPQRQRLIAVRPARPNERPSWSRMVMPSPSRRIGPLLRTMILMSGIGAPDRRPPDSSGSRPGLHLTRRRRLRVRSRYAVHGLRQWRSEYPGGYGAAPPSSMTQKSTRSENCMIRGSPARLVMVARVAVFEMLKSGRPRLARLNTLNASQRRIAPTRPLSLTRFWRLKSRLEYAGPRRMLRPALPNVPE